MNYYMAPAITQISPVAKIEQFDHLWLNFDGPFSPESGETATRSIENSEFSTREARIHLKSCSGQEDVAHRAEEQDAQG
jgi:hypothetical protein